MNSYASILGIKPFQILVGGLSSQAPANNPIGKQILTSFSESAPTTGPDIGYKSGIDYTKTVVYGRDDFPPKVRKVIKEFGNKPISKLTIVRHPLADWTVEALNFASLGEFKKRYENEPYEKLYHLGLLINFTDNTSVLIEKNEVINAVVNPNIPPEDEEKVIKQFPPDLTLNIMIEGAKEKLGDNLYKYNAGVNNCQSFVNSLIYKFSDIEEDRFVKQNTEQLFKGLPAFTKSVNTITNLGAKVNEITEGTGLIKHSRQVDTGIRRKIKGNGSANITPVARRIEPLIPEAQEVRPLTTQVVNSREHLRTIKQRLIREIEKEENNLLTNMSTRVDIKKQVDKIKEEKNRKITEQRTYLEELNKYGIIIQGKTEEIRLLRLESVEIKKRLDKLKTKLNNIERKIENTPVGVPELQVLRATRDRAPRDRGEQLTSIPTLGPINTNTLIEENPPNVEARLVENPTDEVRPASGTGINKPQIYCVLFIKPYKLVRAIDWLNKHNYKFDKIENHTNRLSFPQIKPNKKYKYITKKINKNIEFIISY
jgi:hypothetical protein